MHYFWGPFAILEKVGPVPDELKFPCNNARASCVSSEPAPYYKRDKDETGARAAFLPDDFVEQIVQIV